MFIKNKKIKKLNYLIDTLNKMLKDAKISEIIEILGNKREIIKRNFIAGVFKGIGIGIGVSLISSILILFLQRVVTLNIPIIGKYISDIVEIVEKSK